MRKFAVMMMGVFAFAAAGCGGSSGSAPDWDAMFELVQKGTVLPGRIESMESAGAPDRIRVSLSFETRSGSRKTFSEEWPESLASQFPKGGAMPVYSDPQQRKLPQASAALLAQEKLVPQAMLDDVRSGA